MNDELIVEVGLKAAFDKAKGGILVSDLRMTENEAAQYWFSVGFRMGHSFANFVLKEKQRETARN